MTVLLMYGLMWGIGLLMIGVSLYKQRSLRSSQKKTIEGENGKIHDQPRKKFQSTSISPQEEIKRMLAKYIDEIFPAVYQSQSYISRMFGEVLKHHRYILLLNTRGEDLNFKKIITCLHMLTVQTMLMFILAVLYDLQVFCLSSYPLPDYPSLLLHG